MDNIERTETRNMDEVIAAERRMSRQERRNRKKRKRRARMRRRLVLAGAVAAAAAWVAYKDEQENHPVENEGSAAEHITDAASEVAGMGDLAEERVQSGDSSEPQDPDEVIGSAEEFDFEESEDKFVEEETLEKF